MGTPAKCLTFDPSELNLDDAHPVGSGAVSQVVCSTLGSPSCLPIAVKILSKVQLLHQKKVQSAMNEKHAFLELAPHPFITRLYGTGQSTDELYFVMEYLPHGDLLQHIRTCTSRSQIKALELDAGLTEKPQKTLPVSAAQIPCLDFHDIQLITAQLVVGLARVFSKGFVLRDLKPENAAFDVKYRLCLLDFDTIDIAKTSVVTASKKNAAPSASEKTNGSQGKPKRRMTISQIQEMRKMSANFCGTAQYISPEMAGKCEWSYSSDLWALGAVVYEMMYGVHMFSGHNTFVVMKRVLNGVHSGEVSFPRVYLGPETDAFERVKDFIFRLCQTDPTRRLGVHPVTGRFNEEALRQHPLFGDFCWSILDEHVQLYRPNILVPQGSDLGLPLPKPGPLHSDVLDDGTESLESYYHVLPVHDPEYAKYVFEMTADANPFERWLQNTSMDGEGVEKESLKGESDAGISATKADVVGDDDLGSEYYNADSTTSDSEMDVVDDIGIQFFGHVHPDFRGTV